MDLEWPKQAGPERVAYNAQLRVRFLADPSALTAEERQRGSTLVARDARKKAKKSGEGAEGGKAKRKREKKEKFQRAQQKGMLKAKREGTREASYADTGLAEDVVGEDAREDVVASEVHGEVGVGGADVEDEAALASGPAATAAPVDVPGPRTKKQRTKTKMKTMTKTKKPSSLPSTPNTASPISGKRDVRALIEGLGRWTQDEVAVEKWARAIALESRLGPRGGPGGGGILHIKNVFPPEVAEGARAALQSLDASSWELAEATNDTGGGAGYGAGSTRHRFRGTDGSEVMEALYECVGRLVASSAPSFVGGAGGRAGGKKGGGKRKGGGKGGGARGYGFASGCYREGDFIEVHDDAAYKDMPVAGGNTNASYGASNKGGKGGAGGSGGADGGGSVLASRDIAVIIYLCKNWTEDDGGLLLDHGAKGELKRPGVVVPKFNSLVAFHVPRLHQVTPVLTRKKKRFSIFGWFLKEGRLYDLGGASGKGGGAKGNAAGAGGAGEGKSAKKKSKKNR